MDMRIHDINVVADLDSHDPTAPDPSAPVENDGTVDGAYEDSAGDYLGPDSRTFDTVWEDAVTGCLPYWALEFGWWPLLVFPLSVTMGELEFQFHLGVDLLFERYVKVLSLPVGDPFELCSGDSYVWSHIDLIVMSLLVAGILTMGPLLSAAEALIRGGVTNLGGAQIALILGAFAVSLGVALGSWFYVESSVSSGAMDHGQTAFTYEMLLLTMVLAIAGADKVIGTRWGGAFVDFLNRIIRAQFGPYTTRAIEHGYMTKYVCLALGVMTLMAMYSGIMWMSHLVTHYRTEV